MRRILLLFQTPSSGSGRLIAWFTFSKGSNQLKSSALFAWLHRSQTKNL
jgi:hypothetical protein